MKNKNKDLQDTIKEMEDLLNDDEITAEQKKILRPNIEKAKKLLANLDQKKEPAKVKKAARSVQEIIKAVAKAPKKTDKPTAAASQRSLKDIVARTKALSKLYAGTSERGLQSDAKRKAKKPGSRKSASGKTYREYRSDRTDISTKKKPYLAKGGAIGNKTEPLAKEFSKLLRKDLSAEEMRAIIKENDKRGDDTCATHDYVDANQYMLDAFENVLGREFIFYDDEKPATEKQHEQDTALWNAAWDMANKNKFYTKPKLEDGGEIENTTLAEAIKHMEETGFAQFRGKNAMDNAYFLEQHFEKKGKQLFQMSYEGTDFTYYDPHHPKNKGTIRSAEHLSKKGYSFAKGGKVKSYDLGFGSMGSGTTVWNRNEEVRGDYKNIAHISDEGKINFYEELPDDVKKDIEGFAKADVSGNNVWHLVGLNRPPKNFTPAAAAAFKKAINELESQKVGEPESGSYYKQARTSMTSLINIVSELLEQDGTETAVRTHKLLQEVGIYNYKTGLLLDTSFLNDELANRKLFKGGRVRGKTVTPAPASQPQYKKHQSGSKAKGGSLNSPPAGGDGGVVRIKSATNRDRAYKSQQKHEQAYRRKTKPANPSYDLKNITKRLLKKKKP